MNTQLSRSFRPSLEALEERRVMNAGGTFAWGGGIFNVDTQLTVTVRTTSVANNFKQIYVDGSIYDDHVEVLEYATSGGNVYMKLRLSQFSGGRLLSTRTVVVNTPSFQYSGWVIELDLKGGNDSLINSTSAPLACHGGTGRDVMFGGSDYDLLMGDAGLDELWGREGRDALFGGDESDTLFGGTGIDRLFGDGGDDYLNGSDDNDEMHGGLGRDTLYGAQGNDDMWGDQGEDRLIGGLDNDKMWGGGENDYLWGEAGSDRLYGDGGADRLYGGDDDDYLDGGYGSYDYLVGGQGGDTFVRHKRVFWTNDTDAFADFNSATGDKIKSVWHA
jgi:Ca2+-binding RTX toxin-like protein